MKTCLRKKRLKQQYQQLVSENIFRMLADIYNKRQVHQSKMFRQTKTPKTRGMEATAEGVEV